MQIARLAPRYTGYWWLRFCSFCQCPKVILRHHQNRKLTFGVKIIGLRNQSSHPLTVLSSLWAYPPLTSVSSCEVGGIPALCCFQSCLNTHMKHRVWKHCRLKTPQKYSARSGQDNLDASWATLSTRGQQARTHDLREPFPVQWAARLVKVFSASRALEPLAGPRVQGNWGISGSFVRDAFT